MVLEPLPTAELADAAGTPIVYGDADGVVVVPYERHGEIVARVRTS